MLFDSLQRKYFNTHSVFIAFLHASKHTLSPSLQPFAQLKRDYRSFFAASLSDLKISFSIVAQGLLLPVEEVDDPSVFTVDEPVVPDPEAVALTTKGVSVTGFTGTNRALLRHP